jgi:hypothetical protein
MRAKGLRVEVDGLEGNNKVNDEAVPRSSLAQLLIQAEISKLRFGMNS